MRNKKILIPVLGVVFLLASASTVFVLAKINEPKSDESSQGESSKDETAAAEKDETDNVDTTEEKTEQKQTEEKKTETAPVSESQKYVEKQRACAKLSEEMNAEIRKEDQRYGEAMNKASIECNTNGGDCANLSKENEKHEKNAENIRTKYNDKMKKSGC